MVLVIQVDDLADTCLYEHLGTFLAGEEGHVDRRPVHVLERSPVVEDGIGLRVDDVVVLVVQGVLRALPGKLVVGDAGGRAVVAYREDALMDVGDAGPDLRVGVLASEARRNGDTHEELVPRDDVRALAGHEGSLLEVWCQEKGRIV